MTTIAETIDTTIAAKLADWGVAYSAEFVPQSRSRNAGEKTPSLNWRVTVGKLTTDYQQGYGHIPAPYAQKLGHTRDEQAAIRDAAENGRYTRDAYRGYPTARLPEPSAASVLYSLLFDSEALDSPFDEWAEDFGYSSDSISAKATYDACIAIGHQMRRTFTPEQMAELRELLADY